ncbi:MAG: DNA polymerase III subunit gamma/tau [Bacteroidales bacterium]|nr:DNA polymerase III subunit gamma/tau [Bacteroidales bacterium]
MEKYIVSARKYRPSTFKTIVGQHALSETLKNAVKTGRLAHSYLFCGQRGVGKTTTARIFAKAINCEHLTPDGEPCNECESCRAFNEQRSLNIIEMDAASNNSVDDIREITNQVLVPPITGKYRVFIIDEVHMLSPAAFNAFLKTLEEPPEYVIFILATTEKNKILPTILSRCQKYDFQSITVADIAEQLQYVADSEGYTTEPAGLNVIAQKSDGAMRDALSIFDQVAASSNGNITYQAVIDNLNILDYDYYFRLVDAFLDANVEDALLVYRDVRNHGFEGKTFINGLANHLRELLMAHSDRLAALMDATGDIADRFREQSSHCALRFIYMALDLCNTCDITYRDATNKQLLVELTLIKICQLNAPDPTPSPQQGNGLKKIEPSHQPTPTPAAAPAAPQPSAQYTATAPQPATAQSAAPQTSASIEAALRDATRSPHVNINLPKPQANNKPKAAVSIPSIADLTASRNADAAPQQPVAQHRSEFFADEDFQHAWDFAIEKIKTDVILANAMRSHRPKSSGGAAYVIVVDNQSQVEAFERAKQQIQTYIRNKLSNDDISIKAVVREINPDEKVWSQKEVLVDILQRNPQGLDFIKRFNFTLS